MKRLATLLFPFFLLCAFVAKAAEVQTPSIKSITPATVVAGPDEFFVKATGSGFDPDTVRILVRGLHCSPCVINNDVLRGVSKAEVTIPMRLFNPDKFAITAQNGEGGPESDPPVYLTATKPK